MVNQKKKDGVYDMSNLKIMKEQKTHGQRLLAFLRPCSHLLHVASRSQQTTRTIIPLYHKTPSLPAHLEKGAVLVSVDCLDNASSGAVGTLGVLKHGLDGRGRGCRLAVDHLTLCIPQKDLRN